MNHSCLVTNDTALLLPHISLLSFREVQKKWQFKSLDVLPEDLDLIPSTQTKANTHLDRQSCLLDSAHTWQPRDPHTQTTGKTFGDKTMSSSLFK